MARSLLAAAATALAVVMLLLGSPLEVVLNVKERPSTHRHQPFVRPASHLGTLTEAGRRASSATLIDDCPIGQLRVRRFRTNPLLSTRSTRLPNVNGPSVVAMPSWATHWRGDKQRLGRLFMYYGSHSGDAIRLAYADAPEGPWREAPAPALTLAALPVCVGHIGSADVHLLPAEHRVRMFFHCPYNRSAVPPGSWRVGGRAAQLTFAAVSLDGGRSFRLETRTPVAPFYLRAFRMGGTNTTWGLALLDMKMQGLLLRAVDGFNFPPNHQVTGSLPRMRHGFVMPMQSGRSALLFFTRVGDAPERIFVATLHVNGTEVVWPPREASSLLLPTAEEGGGAPVVPSERGGVSSRVHQLRDPAAFRCCGARTFLFWAFGGEQGIAGGELVCDPAADTSPVEPMWRDKAGNARGGAGGIGRIQMKEPVLHEH